MTAVWEPVETLTTKRSREIRGRLEYRLGSPTSWTNVVKLDNGVLIDVAGIIRMASTGSFWHRTKQGEIYRNDLAEYLGMGIKEFRVFRQKFDPTFPAPCRVVDHGRGQPILFWDIEEVLEWADAHQIK